MGQNRETHGFIGGQAITTSDGTDIPGGAVRGFVVGVAGDVKVTMVNGDVVTWPALVAGIPHAIQCTRIWATGTTATGIVAGR